MASSATSSLSASERAALAPAQEWRPSLPPARPLRMAPHRRGGGAGGDDVQLPPEGPGMPEAGPRAHFLDFPWPEVMDIFDQQEQQPPDASSKWQ